MQPMNARRDTGIRRDPAPSRWNYRYERLMLTPLYRRLFRIGPPVLGVALVVGIFFASADRREMVSDKYNEIVYTIQHRPEFMVGAMAVDGADAGLADEVRGVLPISFPISSFDLDLEAMRFTVEQINGVQSATLRIKPGGTLEIAVIPRIPVAIWRQDNTLTLMDADGHFVASIASRADRLDLPLIAGDGAKDALPEAMALFRAAGPITEKLRGLVRMGERRWDVVLEGEQRILLPEENPILALERVVLMEETQQLLSRDITVVDMRNESRPTLRLSEAATEEMRRVNASVSGTGN